MWQQGDALNVEIVDYHWQAKNMKPSKLQNIHLGEVLLEEFLHPMGISQNRLARDIGVPPRRINEVVYGKRAVTADTALRFSHHFGTSNGFWMGLQVDYDLEEARERLGPRLEREAATRAA